MDFNSNNKYNLFVFIASNTNSSTQIILENSLKRYIKYFYQMEIECKVFTTKFNILKELESCSINDYLKFIDLDYDQDIEYLLKILTTNNGFEKGASSEYFEKIKRKLFYNFIKSFSHAMEDDLVNSEIGVLNILCLNKKKVDDNTVKGAEEKIKKFKTCIEKNLVPFNEICGLKHEIDLLLYHTNKVIELLKILNINNNKTTLSQGLKFIFKFISDYSKK